ncbi:MAG TPA: [FeFe] hydrogenase H-cluster maturation GTPase HydF [Salinivirgaceae bacterium]|nr:[FeFe] hydrogenase H-cluster maturation GTPase HydF [Salinivirgaceae bacterium]
MANISTRDLKPQIGIFGRRNVGKSSFINTITGQDIAIVSEVAGTTTDPVKRTVEILDFAPVVVIDTAGIDDEGELGEKRIQRSLRVIQQIDLALVLFTENRFGATEENLITLFKQNDIPFLLIYTKTDISKPDPTLLNKIKESTHQDVLLFSNKIPEQLPNVIEAIKKAIPETAYSTPTLLGDIIGKDDIVMLIMPIDSEAPAGRLILPQVQVLRDMLDNYAVSIVVQPEQIHTFLKNTGVKPKLAITDSQLFYRADTLVPEDIPLTGYSIVMARFKGNFEAFINGTPYIDELKDGDRILILESCSHHVNCEDIGRFKIPNWMRKYTGKNLQFDIIAGLSPVERSMNDYALVVQCGGCMITRKQLHSRIQPYINAGIPVTNYGMAIAYMHGYYNRVMEPFIKHTKSKV